MAKRLTAIDAFCGSGGLSLGIERAGFDLVTAFDNDEASVRTHNKNMPGSAFVGDAKTLTAAALRKQGGLRARDELDLLAGGPPCQGFSKQKRGAHLGDSRNELVLEFLRLVEELEPRAFLMENVATLAGVRGAHLVERFNSLERYTLTGHFYLAANYGVPQTRQRFVLVGIRDDVKGRFKIPEPSTPEWPTVGSVLAGLPEPPTDYSVHPNYPNHQAARVTAKNIDRFSHVPQGGGWQDIPFEKRLKCHQVVDVKSGGWPDVYGRLRWDGQCPTITGGFDSFSRGRYGHPLQDRPLTPREAARIQGFPDDYAFDGTRHEVRHQIGNAVPVTMATEVVRAIRTTLNARG
ncbi:DNA cytosine methyltransferase [Rhodococcus globerulus]|uniref:DNA cytosine methyltransferase n=1 Tax=Rhodococcus globerulus TaxID=33008 RepID=UPI000A898420|nr:DNA cytosine methyltransferase [Rhodococcus globerulus]